MALNHIDPYTPNLINMNCTILEIDENDIVNEPATSLAEIPDFLLDEWANEYQFDPILEKDALIPSLMKNKKDTSGT